jgi:uncharacterized protein YndB with AHSA1/START domain
MTHTPIFNDFTIERTYPQSKAQVFAALSDPAKKRRWFAEADGFVTQSYTLDFQVGGFERSRFTFGSGPQMTLDSVFTEITPGERLVFAYWMTIGGEALSSSLCAMQLESVAGGTKLTFTEHTAYLNGEDGGASRREGSIGLLERLARELSQHA